MLSKKYERNFYVGRFCWFLSTCYRVSLRAVSNSSLVKNNELIIFLFRFYRPLFKHCYWVFLQIDIDFWMLMFVVIWFCSSGLVFLVMYKSPRFSKMACFSVNWVIWVRSNILFLRWLFSKNIWIFKSFLSHPHLEVSRNVDERGRNIVQTHNTGPPCCC